VTKLSLVGQKFGRLKVVAEYALNDRVLDSNWRYSRWLCECDCGGQKVLYGTLLVRGMVRSCGCLLAEYRVKLGDRQRTHGCSTPGSLTYRSWLSIKTLSKKLGVPMCEEWWHSFEAFLLDMGERPEGTKLRRIDQMQGYEPGNCFWRPNTTHRGIKLPVAGAEALPRNKVVEDAFLEPELTKKWDDDL
jgi:hypothetical protein